MTTANVVTTLPPPPPPLAESGDDAREGHVLVARYRKARVLADYLAQYVETANAETAAQSVAVLGQAEVGRQLAAQAAGTRVPSEVTWALVVELVREDAT